jgi:hypothetical protein
MGVARPLRFNSFFFFFFFFPAKPEVTLKKKGNRKGRKGRKGKKRVM